jgi:hypothetical protein
MKCVKELSTDLITRINDERAQSLVKKSTHVYVSKEIWKQSRIKESEHGYDLPEVHPDNPVEKPKLKAKERKAKERKGKK